MMSLIFALPAVALIALLWKIDQNEKKARANTRAELIPILNDLVKSLDVEAAWPKTSRR